MRRLVLVAFPLVVLAAGCAAASGPPDRAPDAVGTAASVETSAGVTEVQFEHDAGFEYFEGTTFVLDGEVTIVGKVTDASAIRGGDHLVVWTDACAESFPVQCQVVAVKVEDGSSAALDEGSSAAREG